VPAVIDENGPGDLRRVEGREIFDLLEDFAQCRVRRLVLAGLPDHFRRNLVNLMNHVRSIRDWPATAQRGRQRKTWKDFETKEKLRIAVIHRTAAEPC
jgi:hypothetical protein